MTFEFTPESFIILIASTEGKLVSLGIGVTLIFLSLFLARTSSDGKGKNKGALSSKPKLPTEIPQDTSTNSILDLGLGDSRNAIWKRFSNFFSEITPQRVNTESEELFQEFEELLIQSDIGVRTSSTLTARLKLKLKGLELSPEKLKSELKLLIIDLLSSDTPSEIIPKQVNGKPQVIFVVGVNGAGKTTTIGKLAFQFGAQGSKVLVAACDTFRAAAAEQLEVWAERAGAQIEKGADGEKPSTVAYRAIHRGLEERFDIILIDTAGRLHTKVNLMNELASITKIVMRESPESLYETFLVVDGSTGQNALQQAREFNKAAELSGIVVTKLDGTPKGGIVIAIKDELKVPVRYIGVGEGVSDLRPFEADEFTEALFGDFDLSNTNAMLVNGSLFEAR